MIPRGLNKQRECKATLRPFPCNYTDNSTVALPEFLMTWLALMSLTCHLMTGSGCMQVTC